MTKDSKKRPTNNSVKEPNFKRLKTDNLPQSIQTETNSKTISTQTEIDTNESKEHQKSKIKQKLYDSYPMIAKNKKKSEKILTN